MSRQTEMTSKELIEIRKKLGLTQAKFAEKLGYNTRSIICHFEKGTKPISPRVALLCGYFLRDLEEGRLENN
mgnify:CR=1 FL=1